MSRFFNSIKNTLKTEHQKHIESLEQIREYVNQIRNHSCFVSADTSSDNLELTLVNDPKRLCDLVIPKQIGLAEVHVTYVDKVIPPPVVYEIKRSELKDGQCHKYQWFNIKLQSHGFVGNVELRSGQMESINYRFDGLTLKIIASKKYNPRGCETLCLHIHQISIPPWIRKINLTCQIIDP